MTRRSAEAVFQGLFLLTDIRGILRETAPQHHLNDEQRAKAAKTLDKLEKQINILREELTR